MDSDSKTKTVIIDDPEHLKKFYDNHKSDIWVGFNSKNYDQYILKAILCGFDPKEVNDYIILQKQAHRNRSDLWLPEVGRLKGR